MLIDRRDGRGYRVTWRVRLEVPEAGRLRRLRALQRVVVLWEVNNNTVRVYNDRNAYVVWS